MGEAEMSTHCDCGWPLPGEGMRGRIASKIPIPTDLTILIVFACPTCGMEWDTELVITFAGKIDEQRAKPS